ncbi:hypothetical protein EUX98_g6856 [Antrodiella citrinella]|uniref:CCT-theta n=1 Tax=Antrodiella citrinella TaxID=2447956 RepID=A0A4S4MMZ7_9APHY|nr:hypothetical protein EUX98_g6856 [Antrodiella citrinella]
MVIILAGELLKKAEHLLIMGLHPSEIIKGYELACVKGLEELEKLSVATLPSPPTLSGLAGALKPAIASKQYGFEDTLAALVAEAALAVMPPNPKNFNVDNVRVVKIMGGSLAGSKVVRGMVFGREPEGMIKRTKKGKVAVFTCGLDIAQTETKGTVLIKNKEEMLNFTTGEEKHLERILQEIADSGVKVIIAGSSVGELAMHYLNRMNIAVLKVLSKFELRRLCRVVNATPLARVGAPTPEEAGYVDVFECIEVGGDRVTVLRQLVDGDEGFDPSDTSAEKTKTATIVLRGATSNHLDDLERAIDDGVSVIKALLKDGRLVPGAGSTELELAKRVDAYGSGLRGLSQHGVRRWASALEVVPRTLAENALGGAEGNEVVSRLWAKHEQEVVFVLILLRLRRMALSMATDYKILDSLAAKSWAIRLATEAAVSVLSVDSIIMSKPAGGPKIPQQAGNWDED